MPRTVVCVYCRQEEVASSRDLVVPCKCGKKDEDRGRWHRACLVEYLRDVEEEHPDYRVEHERCGPCAGLSEWGPTAIFDLDHVLCGRGAPWPRGCADLGAQVSHVQRAVPDPG